jgi:UDP-N-acetyl-D-mannosaminuronate dehydrogenase
MELIDKIKRKEARIGVIGLGYVAYLSSQGINRLIVRAY